MTRQMFYRVIADGETLLQVRAGGIRISQTLEGAGPTVASIDVSGPSSFDLQERTTIEIYQLDVANPVSGVYKQRLLFTGEIDQISGASYPHNVRLTCLGYLSRLNRTRTSDLYFSINDDWTDVDMAKNILTYCGIAYDADNIQGIDQNLVLATDLIWRAGVSGRDLLQEIDNLTGCVTFELGDGTACRIPWYPWGKAYSDLDATSGELARVQVFRRGQNGIMFYRNERERGGADQVKTFFRVSGYQVTDETDGCNYQIKGTGHDPIGVLGAGIYTGSEEISSELIQSPEFAADIAKRHLQWYNRYPDNIRIYCGNDYRITVGDIVGVVDPVWGVDLSYSDADPLCYRVTQTEREGDFMTITCIGGPEGNTDGAEIRGWQNVCCGIQNEDGTCTENDDTGPGSGPVIPDVPDIPNVPNINCDPLTDTTCLPGTDPDIPVLPDSSSPYFNCTEGVLLPVPVGSDLEAACAGTPPANPCWDHHYSGKYDTIGNLGTTGYECDCKVFTFWRGESDTSGRHLVDNTGALISIRSTDVNVDWYYSTVEDPTAQTAPLDVEYASKPLINITATLNFQRNSQAAFRLEEFGGGGDFVEVKFYGGNPVTTEDLDHTECEFGWVVSGMPGLANVNYCSTPRNSFPNVFHQNAGQYGGSVAPLDTDVRVSVFFDLTDNDMYKVQVTGDMGEGYAESKPGTSAGPDTNTWRLNMRLNRSPGFVPSSRDQWGVLVKDMIIGDVTCEENPHYVPPGTDI